MPESRLSSTSRLHVAAGANRAAVGKDGQMMRGARNGRNSATELIEKVRRGKENLVTIETNGVLLKWGRRSLGIDGANTAPVTEAQRDLDVARSGKVQKASRAQPRQSSATRTIYGGAPANASAASR